MLPHPAHNPFCKPPLVQRREAICIRQTTHKGKDSVQLRLQPFFPWVTGRKHSTQTRTELLQCGPCPQVRIDASEVEV